MPAIESKIDVSGEAFARNRAHMLVADRARCARSKRARASKSAQAKPLFDRRGQLLPRERVARLLDIGAPWLELSLASPATASTRPTSRSPCPAAA